MTEAPTIQRTREIVSRFASTRIAVVGDFLADIYVDARPARVSREAPVLVATVESERFIPGGAANSVNNLVALGARVIPVGVVGDDHDGRRLRGFLDDVAVDSRGLVADGRWQTVSKTRIMAGAENRSRQQLLRLDREPANVVGEPLRRRLVEALRAAVADVDGVVVSDYGYGLVDRGIVDEVLAHRPSGAIVTADSRHGLASIRGVDLVTPNHVEAEEIIGATVSSDEETASAARVLRDRLAARAVIITRGNRGMLVLDDEDGTHVIPAAGSPDEVTDVSGAGDTVTSVVTLAMASGATVVEAAHLANVAAGVVVTRLGAATCDAGELLRAAGAVEEESGRETWQG